MKLVPPSKTLFPSFRESMLEWGGAHQDGAGIRDAELVAQRRGFESWVEQLLAEEAAPAGEGFVTCTYCWMVEGGEYLGSIALRHELTDFHLAFIGHIGYSVRPSARGKGLTSEALGSVLKLAGDRGLPRVLLTCDADNPASRRTIERNGGLLENEVEHDGRTLQRFWIPTTVE
jgi:predicted acetyltransferase